MNIQQIQDAFLSQGVDLTGRLFDLKPLLGQGFEDWFLITDYHRYKSLDPLERFAEMQAKSDLIRKLGLHSLEVTVSDQSTNKFFPDKGIYMRKEEHTALLYPNHNYEKGITQSEVDILLTSMKILFGLDFNFDAANPILEKILTYCRCWPTKILGNESSYLTLMLFCTKLEDSPENISFVEEYVAYHKTWEDIYLFAEDVWAKFSRHGYPVQVFGRLFPGETTSPIERLKWLRSHWQNLNVSRDVKASFKACPEISRAEISRQLSVKINTHLAKLNLKKSPNLPLGWKVGKTVPYEFLSGEPPLPKFPSKRLFFGHLEGDKGHKLYETPESVNLDKIVRFFRVGSHGAQSYDLDEDEIVGQVANLADGIAKIIPCRIIFADAAGLKLKFERQITEDEAKLIQKLIPMKEAIDYGLENCLDEDDGDGNLLHRLVYDNFIHLWWD